MEEQHQSALRADEDRGELRATKYARHIWFLKKELEAFFNNKTES